MITRRPTYTTPVYSVYFIVTNYSLECNGAGVVVCDELPFTEDMPKMCLSLRAFFGVAQFRVIYAKS